MHRLGYSFFAAALCFMVDVGRAVTRSIDRFILFLIDTVAEKRTFSLDLGTDGPALASTGAPLDASLLQSLRHEAGVRRRSADRHI